MDKKMKEMEEENRRRAREIARIESIQSKQKKKQKSKENGTKQKGYVAGAKMVNDDAKFIVTRISPIADLKEIKEYCGVCFDGESYELTGSSRTSSRRSPRWTRPTHTQAWLMEKDPGAVGVLILMSADKTTTSGRSSPLST